MATTNENTMVVYKKTSLDQVVALLDQLCIKGETVKNAQIITGVVQILQTQGTPQEVATTDAAVPQTVTPKE